MIEIRRLFGVLLVYLAAFGLVRIFTEEITFTIFSHYRPGLISSIWIIVPSLVLIFQNKKFKDYGISIRGWKQSLKITLVASVIILTAYLIGYYVYTTVICNKTFSPVIQENLMLSTINMILFVGLPEEYFFRGYLQSELNFAFGKKYSFLKVKFGPGLFIASLIFTLSHVFIRGDPSRFNTIFVSLILGWLREKSGTIVAPIGFHTLSNVTYILALGFFKG